MSNAEYIQSDVYQCQKLEIDKKSQNPQNPKNLQNPQNPQNPQNTLTNYFVCNFVDKNNINNYCAISPWSGPLLLLFK